MSQTHPFDAAIRLEPQGEGHWRGHTHEAYGNMVGPFGGATAAAALAAVLATRRETWSAVEAGFPLAPAASCSR